MLEKIKEDEVLFVKITPTDSFIKGAYLNREYNEVIEEITGGNKNHYNIRQKASPMHPGKMQSVSISRLEDGKIVENYVFDLNIFQEIDQWHSRIRCETLFETHEKIIKTLDGKISEEDSQMLSKMLQNNLKEPIFEIILEFDNWCLTIQCHDYEIVIMLSIYGYFKI